MSELEKAEVAGTSCISASNWHLFAVTRYADCPFTPATDNRAVEGSAQGDLTAYTSKLAITIVGSMVIRMVLRGIVAVPGRRSPSLRGGRR